MRHIPQTGQTRCYDGAGREIPCAGSGHDGADQRGVPWPSVRFLPRDQVVVD